MRILQIEGYHLDTTLAPGGGSVCMNVRESVYMTQIKATEREAKRVLKLENWIGEIYMLATFLACWVSE